MGTASGPRAPAGLGTKGAALWRQIAGKYALRPDELTTLEDACREADLIDRLELALADADLMVKGSMGQLVSSPLVSEIRQHRTVKSTLLKSLKLPDDEEPAAAPPGATGSNSARSAARARWNRPA